MLDRANRFHSRRVAWRIPTALCGLALLLALPGCAGGPFKKGPYAKEYTLHFAKGPGQMTDTAVAIQVLLCDDRDDYAIPARFQGDPNLTKAQIEQWMMGQNKQLRENLSRDNRFRQITFRPEQPQSITFGKDVMGRLIEEEALNAKILIVANFSVADNPNKHFTRITLRREEPEYDVLISQGEVVAKPVPED